MVVRVPQVDKVLREPILVELAQTMRRDLIAQLVRFEIEGIKAEWNSNADGNNKKEREAASAKKNATDLDEISSEQLARRVKAAADELFAGGVRRVINGTGVILNTNLGRAPLPVPVLDRLHSQGQGYSSLEMELLSGKRGERTQHIKRLLKVLTGCESAIVVNNNASAVMLAVSALARGKEVIVSRGELIEIGGSFRLPDVVTSAGGILKEVGTTNRTRASDYKNAITPDTGLILQCHRSNFEITGFTEEASLTELVEIGTASGVPVGLDLGSGALIDIAQFGLRHEPTVDEVIGAGVSLVMFSGDKLLGGPQAGIIAGRSDLVGKLRKDPMYRALRADKLIITLLESVLGEYLKVRPEEHVPVYALASVPATHIKERVEKFSNRIAGEVKQAGALKVVETVSTLGGGSLPGQSLPSFGLQLPLANFKSAGKLSAALREAQPPVISIIQDDKVIVDFRTVLPGDEKELERVVIDLFKRL